MHGRCGCSLCTLPVHVQRMGAASGRLLVLATTLSDKDSVLLLASADNPVTDDTLKEWAGFVSMIVEAYFNRRMAW